jgi:hypothetical protein
MNYVTIRFLSLFSLLVCLYSIIFSTNALAQVDRKLHNKNNPIIVILVGIESKLFLKQPIQKEKFIKNYGKKL